MQLYEHSIALPTCRSALQEAHTSRMRSAYTWPGASSPKVKASTRASSNACCTPGNRSDTICRCVTEPCVATAWLGCAASTAHRSDVRPTCRDSYRPMMIRSCEHVAGQCVQHQSCLAQDEELQRTRHARGTSSSTPLGVALITGHSTAIVSEILRSSASTTCGQADITSPRCTKTSAQAHMMIRCSSPCPTFLLVCSIAPCRPAAAAR